MAVTTFEVDERTLQTIQELKEAFGVKTNAAVIRKSLALARIAARRADADHTIDLSGEKVSLVG